MNYLVYCIFEAEQGPQPAVPAGVDGQPVHLIEEDGLIAAVSRVSDRTSRMCPDVDRALVYAGVVETFHRGRAVLPMRYGCLLKDESRVIELLRRHGQVYRSALKELRGCVEIGVRILAEDVKRDVRHLKSPSDAPIHSPGKAYLVARRAHYAEADRSAEQQAAVVERCRAAFAGLFLRCKTEYPSLPGATLWGSCPSFYFLVKQENLDVFRQAFQALSRREPTKMLLSGPWPPYNFVPPGE